jgi:hypothetical protein
MPDHPPGYEDTAAVLIIVPVCFMTVNVIRNTGSNVIVITPRDKFFPYLELKWM